MQREHGPERCHRVVCDAEPCKGDKNAYVRRVRRLKAYGRWESPFVDAAPVREHVNFLRASHMGIECIHEVSGVSTKALTALVYGVNGRPPSERVRAETARKLLAVRPRLELLLPGARIDATGTRRRLQALQCVGWPQRRLADLLDSRPVTVGRIVRSEQSLVTVGKALQVRDLYDRLWNSPPQAYNRSEMHSIRVAQRTAAVHGWVPPMAWDEDTIDDPNAVPEGAEVGQETKQRLPGRDDLQMLIETGSTVAALAQRFDVKEDSVKTTLRRCGLKAAP